MRNRQTQLRTVVEQARRVLVLPAQHLDCQLQQTVRALSIVCTTQDTTNTRRELDKWSFYARAFQRSFAAEAAAAPLEDNITLMEGAVQRMRELQAKEGSDAAVLRITVEGGGCSGFQYIFSLGRGAEAGDRVFESGGVQVVCDDVSFEFLRGAKVDYNEDLIRSAFEVVVNPNASQSCGCGSSFNAK